MLQVPRRVFILSPAHCGGERAQLIFNPEARFDLAIQIRTSQGAALGETFRFLSGLYFRGKLAYGQRFANPLRGTPGVFIITTNRGLLAPETRMTLKVLRAMAQGEIDPELNHYRLPLERDLKKVAEQLGPRGQAVLLGSIASGKYVDILLDCLGSRLMFPEEFVGRGDMSRGGLLLRCVDEGRELNYIAAQGAVRRGVRPPKLARRKPRQAATGS